ncbi:ankyrin repeat domain-containing protein [Aestuariibaculum sediminum]|uniref:Ankyrin repeat domain-containing protein n=1 Tax=Aestuariibaculum sediminum TaxID=2770637 RepID=A0A8J6U8Y0_9FLAO|nr:ankyrin repeat domain-containing protein [Aestuariibaculum sediminum]MBD0832292.1 ankyrin repeat domain-containing protein [Aestuariibaculum sediminum]
MRSVILFLFSFVLSSTFSWAQNDIFNISRNGSLDDLLSLYKQDPNCINTTNQAGYSPLILACYHGNEEVAFFLIEHSNDINGSSHYGTPLMAAVVKKNIDITKKLLDKKADPNIPDLNGTTALHYATLFKATEIAKLLIESGADYNLKDGNDKSAYDYALINNNKELLTLFKN